MAKELSEFRHRSEETGELIYFCPDCSVSENGNQTFKEFDTLQKFKTHMQTEHGGYTISDVEEETGMTGTTSDSAETGAVKQTTPTEKTAPVRAKKLSVKSRELNEKLNDAVKLCVKHLIKGLDDNERSRLSDLTNEVAVSWVGIEIDFEQKLFNISGKWASIILVLALYIVPQLPSLKDMLAEMKKKTTEQQTNASTSASDD